MIFNPRIRYHIFSALLVFCLMSRTVYAGPIGPEYVYDPDNRPPLTTSLQSPLEFAPALSIACNPISHHFNMDTEQVITLIDTETKQCSSGAGFVLRSWDTDPIVLQPTADTELTATLDATTIPLNAGRPIVNILLYSEPRDASDYCMNLLDTASKNTEGSFAEALQQPGEAYTFSDPQTGNPLILEAGKDYYIYAHVSASFSSGTADITFTTSNCKASSIPTMSEWGMVFMSLILGATAVWMIRRRTS